MISEILVTNMVNKSNSKLVFQMVLAVAGDGLVLSHDNDDI